MSTAIIIQARSGSKRLPNKILKPFFQEKCILQIIIDISLKVFNNNRVIVATTKTENDKQVVEIAKKNNIKFYCGDEEDVLSRFIEIGTKFELKKIIRVCSDNPFLDLEGLRFLKNELISFNGDYLSFCNKKSEPTISLHYGLWAEGVTLNALKSIKEKTSNKYFFEHVTNFLYQKNSSYRIKLFQISSTYESSQIRLTVDTIEDFNSLKKLYFKWIHGNSIDIKSLYQIIQKDKELKKIMKKEIKKNEK
jgi:spore coat polysaccharide biosynthesis protein SpsF (cytidylyltransferase family)